MPRFADPWLLLALAVPLLLLWWRERRGGAAFSGFALAAEALRPSRGPLLHRVLVAAGLAALVLAAARPQLSVGTVTDRQQEGRDLMLVIDLSGSMQVDDLADADGKRSDRLAAVMEAARQFISNRPNDRIGLVFFGDQALTSCPLTYDHGTVIEFLERTERQQRALWRQGNEGGLLGGATNLGLGMGTALRGLKDPKSKGRAMVIITDGADSRELPTWVDPLLAARHADAVGVRVYAIGVGNPEGSMTRRDEFGRLTAYPLPPGLLPDMPRLESIVKLANGQSFAANDRTRLAGVFKRIDELEPTPRSVPTREDYADRFWLPLAAGVALLAVALAMEPRLRGVA
jgi:Ca-activated chloride channel family protein